MHDYYNLIDMLDDAQIPYSVLKTDVFSWITIIDVYGLLVDFKFDAITGNLLSVATEVV